MHEWAGTLEMEQAQSPPVHLLGQISFLSQNLPMEVPRDYLSRLGVSIKN